MKNLTTLYMATALSAMLSACGDSTPPDITSVQAYVTGHVTDPAGAPVAGAAVRIQATQPSTGNVYTEESTSTGSDGAFAATLRVGLVSPHVTDILLTATPPAGAGLAPSTTTGLSVAFSSEDPPTDTLHVEVGLQAQ
jgi:Carboxypeptidase regulatory-like domain